MRKVKRDAAMVLASRQDARNCKVKGLLLMLPLIVILGVTLCLSLSSEPGRAILAGLGLACLLVAAIYTFVKGLNLL